MPDFRARLEIERRAIDAFKNNPLARTFVETLAHSLDRTSYDGEFLMAAIGYPRLLDLFDQQQEHLKKKIDAVNMTVEMTIVPRPHVCGKRCPRAD